MTKEVVAQAIASVPFQQWLRQMESTEKHKRLMKLQQITLQSVDFFGKRVGFLKFSAHVADADDITRTRSVVVFMRGGSVAILVLLKCKEKVYTVLVCQDTVPTAQVAFPALPAGMLDGNGNFAGVAAKELQEETGIIISDQKLVDLISLTYGNKYLGMYPSVGGSDEFIRLYLYRETVPPHVLTELEGKCTGVAEENEKIVLKLVPLDEAWKHTSDAKALSALCLYDNLVKAGTLEWK